MRIVEVSGKTVDEAVDRALEQLALSLDQVDVDVISEGKRGVFGIGQEPAIVRVTARVEEAAPAARPPRERESRPEPRRDVPREGAPAAGERAPRAERPRNDGSSEDRPREDRPREDRPRDDRPRSGGGRSAGGNRNGNGRSRGGDNGGMRARGGNEGIPPRGTGEVGPPVGVPGAPEEDWPVAPLPDVEDEVDFAGRTMRDVLTLLGLTDTEIAARDPETPGDGLGLVTQILDVYGENEDASHELGLLIGRRGDTLASLQYLLNVLVSTRYGNDHVFAVDIDQYKRRREDSLVEMARRIAEEVRETGDVITLEPMPAAERRIIHVTLAEEPGVRTESVGQGYNRQVEVMPAEDQ